MRNIKFLTGRRLAFWFMLCILAGILAFDKNKAFVFVLFFSGVVLQFFKYAKEGNEKEAVIRLAIYAGLFVLSVSNYALQKHFYDASSNELICSDAYSHEGIIKDKSYKNEKYIYEVRLREGSVIIYDKDVSREFMLGERISFDGKLKGFDSPVNEGMFDEKTYYLGKKILAKGFPDSICSVMKPKFMYREYMYRLRIELCNIYVLSTDDKTAGMLSAMVAGEKTLLDNDMADSFRTVGIFHILCISGLHISVLGVSLYSLLRWLKLKRSVASLISGYFLFSYLLLSGMAVSALRAVIMFFVYLTADNLGENKDNVSALSITAVAFMIVNPFVLNQAGFIFSFYMFLAVNIVGEHLDKRYGKVFNTVISSVFVFCFTLPVTALYYYEVPTLSFLLNIIISPLIGIVLVDAVMAGAIGIFVLPAVKHILIPAELICRMFALSAKFTESLPFSTMITGCPSVLRLTVCFGFSIGAVILVHNLDVISEESVKFILFGVNLLRKKKASESEGLLSEGEKFIIKERIRYIDLIISVILTPIIILAVLYMPQEKGFSMNFLDVGQGDAIYIRTEDGVNLFIDGGSSSVSDVGKYRIEKFLKYKGVRKIDVWALSHLDNDHVSGFKELACSYEIGTVVVGANNIYDSDYKSLKETLDKENISVYELSGEDEIILKDLHLSVLLPVNNHYAFDRNKDSLVLLMNADGISALFAGDITAEEEEYIKNELPFVDIYKAIHHGSKYSNSKVLLNKIKPSVAVISCGKNNRYGHPSKEAIENLTECGCSIFYTMKSGRVRIEKKNDIIVVNEYCKLK